MNSQNDENSVLYEFDGFRLDAAKCLLNGPDGRSLPLKAKAFETLLFLVQNPGRVVRRDEIMDAVWPGTAVEENNLTQHISSLRRSLGETKDEHRFILTVPGRGYRFVAEVRIADRAGGAAPQRSVQNSSPKPGFAIIAVIVLTSLLLLGFLYQRRSTPLAGERIRSVAVLPLKPLGDGDPNASFEMGITNDLITRLEGAEGITVRSFEAVRQFAAREVDVSDVGAALQVDAVLDGTVQFSEKRVRISAKLIRVHDAKQIWAESFEEERADLFAVQVSMANHVADALAARLTETSKKAYTASGEAYELYLAGRSHQFNLEQKQARLGIAKFEQAIAIDPNFALAHVGIARGYMSLVLSSEIPPEDMGDRAVAAAEKAVQMDPQLGEAHAMLGAVRFWFDHDWENSEAALKKAIELEPNSAFAHLYYAVLLGNTGRIDEALAESKKARELDEFWAYSTSMQGTTLTHAGRPNEALERFGEAARLNRRLWTPHCKAALALIDLHRYDEAIAEAQKAAELNPGQTNSIAFESYAQAQLGRHEEARKLLDDMLARNSERYVPPYHIAVAYAGLGERTKALDWLEKAYSERDPKIVFIGSERFWNEYRSEHRYIELLKKLKLDTKV